jgi:hypothetical protein
MARRRSNPLPVAWYIPNGKRPIARTTSADADLIRYLAADGLTFNEAHAAIHFAPEAKAAVKAYIDRGYGDSPMTDLAVR